MSEKEKIQVEKTNGKEEKAQEKQEVAEKKVKKKSLKEPLIDENEILKSELAEQKEKALRAIAELENFKKRTLQERENNLKYSNMYLIEKLLPALDQFNLVVSYDVQNQELKNYLTGFKMINDQIFKILEEDGLKLVETEGKQFDPKYHFAAEKEKDETKQKGEILRTTQTGYIYKERVIRPAIVVVNEWSEENGNNE